MSKTEEKAPVADAKNAAAGKVVKITVTADVEVTGPEAFAAKSGNAVEVSPRLADKLISKGIATRA